MPNPISYIAFAGKRVVEQTLKKTIPEGSQVAEYLFHKGLFDPIVPRNTLKGVLSELFQLHAFFPLNPKKSSRALSSIIYLCQTSNYFIGIKVKIRKMEFSLVT